MRSLVRPLHLAGLLCSVTLFDAGCAGRRGADSAEAPIGTSVTTAASDGRAPRPSAPPASIRRLAEGAVQLDGLGRHRRVVHATAEAQRYFDQGLALTYGFNHDEAARSFARAAEIDPSCAMCFWGAALVLGPNYNVPMLPHRAEAAWAALERARLLVERAPGAEKPADRALVLALTRRYKGPEAVPPAAMQRYSEAYAAAMRDVARRYPVDDDVQVLFAESLMDVKPWKLWTLEGDPTPGTPEIVATLERVLARSPEHPGANHYYIHAVEASRHPEAAEPVADRLTELMPGAGHIVHMPAHIYQRVGRYADASDANERAVSVDVATMRRAKPTGYYPMYLGHNYGFLAFSASMEGRRAVALSAARESAKAMPPGMIDMMPGMDFFVSEPLLAMVRFGAWDELLREPRPDAKYLVHAGFWLHAHGMALAAKGRLDEARKDLAELERVRAATPAELAASNNAARDVLAVAAKVLEARIATRGKQPNALAIWSDAVALADRLAYAEPDDWFYPVRHFQGAALLDAGRAEEAEVVYREDLRRHPHNGWALFGLAKSLSTQRRAAEAAQVRAEFDRAWKRADITLTSTAF